MTMVLQFSFSLVFEDLHISYTELLLKDTAFLEVKLSSPKSPTFKHIHILSIRKKVLINQFA